LSLLTHLPTPYSRPLPLHDALPISAHRLQRFPLGPAGASGTAAGAAGAVAGPFAPGQQVCRRQRGAKEMARATWKPHTKHGELRSEEHTSELQSLTNLVCRLLLEKK